MRLKRADPAIGQSEACLETHDVMLSSRPLALESDYGGRDECPADHCSKDPGEPTVAPFVPPFGDQRPTGPAELRVWPHGRPAPATDPMRRIWRGRDRHPDTLRSCCCRSRTDLVNASATFPKRVD